MTTKPGSEPEARVVEMGYAARLPGCGCLVAAQVDRPEYKRDVSKFRRDHASFPIEHLSLDEIRSLPWGWPCEHMKAGAVTRERSPDRDLPDVPAVSKENT